MMRNREALIHAPRLRALSGVALFAATIFASAFLLFQVQPLIARVILPWFGGTAAVWAACLMFFQVLLLVGYAYAHLLSTRFPPRLQGILHIGVVVASLALLPVLPGETWKPAEDGDPTERILLLLAATVGLPYLVLATTGPLAQSWFARAMPDRTPYRLFALSNFGSMLALLSYPVAVEPVLATRTQALAWSWGYGVFAVLVSALALGQMRLAEPAARLVALPGGDRPGWREQGAWLVLAAIPSVLLLAVTTHLTQNISPIPLLWVVPLALYLMTFILAFGRDGAYRRRWYFPALAVLAAGMAYALADPNKNTTLWILIPLFCAGLFTAGMICHGELARLRPAPRYLTAYYLLIALGGAAGGVFVGLVAPRLFGSYHELPLGIAGCLAVVAVVVHRAAGRALDRRRALAASAATVGIAVLITGAMAWQASKVERGSLLVARNFYGTLRVQARGTGEYAERSMLHGTISHGRQYTTDARRGWPTSYYGPESGAARAILATRTGAAQRVGVVGLGTGTLAAYGRTGDLYRFYEINPLVVDVAGEYFTYLSDTRASVELVLGDARLSMEREASQDYDVLAVDAFSSDSIPVHLLTREAFAVYFRHLRPGGLLAVHVSNRYLDLEPVVAAAAAHFGKAMVRIENREEPDRAIFYSVWLLLADSGETLAALGLGEAAAGSDAAHAAWTDDFSNLYGILRWPDE